MAKKPRINKTQAVREYLQAHPHTPNKGVAEALTKQGIPITANHVSAPIKAKSRKKRSAVKAVVTKSGVGIPETNWNGPAEGMRQRCRGQGSTRRGEEIKAIWSS